MKAFKIDNEPKITAGFSVPENYFETFSATLLSELPMQKSKVIPLWSTKTKISLVVAALFVVALSLPLYYHFSSTKVEFDTISAENYLANQSNITQYELINNLDLTQQHSNNEITITDATIIEDYLLKEGNLEQLIIE